MRSTTLSILRILLKLDYELLYVYNQIILSSSEMQHLDVARTSKYVDNTGYSICY
jgi:hypothetical protein